MTIKKIWLTPRELQEEYSMSMSTQAKWRMDRKIPFSKVGKYIRYNRNVIDKWLEANAIHTLNEVA